MGGCGSILIERVLLSTLVFQIPNLLWLVIPVRDIEQIEVIPDGGTITSGILIGTKHKVLNTLIEILYLAILLLVLLLLYFYFYRIL